MKATLTIVLSLLLGMTLLPVPALHAANQDEQPRSNLFPPPQTPRVTRPAEPEQQSAVSERRASDLARQNYPGNVLNIRRENRRWNVRMEQEGTVFDVFVDAESGRVSRASDKD